MCREYWEGYGSPRIDTVEVRRAAELIAALYERQWVGGHFHIVTDDWNLDDENVACCVAEVAAGTNAWADSPVDADLGALLTAMSEEERASALGLFEGFWVAPLAEPAG